MRLQLEGFLAIFCSACAMQLKDGETVCGHCGQTILATDDTGKSAPVLETQPGAAAGRSSGDWPWLVLIGFAVAAGVLILDLHANLSFLSSPGFRLYDLEADPNTLDNLVVGQILAELAQFGLLLYLAFLLLPRKRAFVRWAIIFLVAQFAVSLFAYYECPTGAWPGESWEQANLFFAGLHSRLAHDVGYSLFAAILSSLYLLRSKSVRSTFVK
jgi:hypothetical protein